MQKIIIFGGTFDPIHKAHLFMAKYAFKKLRADRLFFIVNNSPLIKNQPIATAQQRMQMLKIAVSGKYKWAEISGFEQSNNKTKSSYTVETLDHFKSLYPRDQLFLLIGDDQYNQFNKWKNPTKIRQLATVVCLKRDQETIKKLNKNDIILNNKKIPISSTQIRKQLDKNTLDPNVLKYLVDNGIYLPNQVKHLMSKYRFDHTVRVCETTVKIATAIDKSLVMKAKIAALIHDIGKEFTNKTMKTFLTKAEQNNCKNLHLLHGKVSANYAKKYFYITDQDILDAVAYHTLPPKICSPLTMILYLSDKLEPYRTSSDIPNRSFLLKQASANLELTFKQVLEYTQAKFKKQVK